MARPKLAPDKLRSERVVTYVTRADYLRGIDNAERAGLSLAEYAREQFVSGRVVIKEYQQLDFTVVDQLRRLGVNLNQLTHLAHIEKRQPTALPRLLEHIERFLAEHVDEPTGS